MALMACNRVINTNNYLNWRPGSDYPSHVRRSPASPLDPCMAKPNLHKIPAKSALCIGKSNNKTGF